MRKYAGLFSREQLDALEEAETAASGDERELLFRLRKTCARPLSPMSDEAEDELKYPPAGDAGHLQRRGAAAPDGAGAEAGGPDVVRRAEVRIGPQTQVGPYAVIEGETTIGARNRIFQFASMGAEPQDLKYHGEPSRLEIGDDNLIREFATIHRGTEGGGMVTRIGNDVLVMNYVHVAHDCIIGDHCILANSTEFAGHIVLEDWVRDRRCAGSISSPASAPRDAGRRLQSRSGRAAVRDGARRSGAPGGGQHDRPGTPRVSLPQPSRRSSVPSARCSTPNCCATRRSPRCSRRTDDSRGGYLLDFIQRSARGVVGRSRD